MQEGIIRITCACCGKNLQWAPTPDTLIGWWPSTTVGHWTAGINSYASIGWVCGKFDRGWTERAVHGKVRSMMSHHRRRSRPVNTSVDLVLGGLNRPSVLPSGCLRGGTFERVNCRSYPQFLHAWTARGGFGVSLGSWRYNGDACEFRPLREGGRNTATSSCCPEVGIGLGTSPPPPVRADGIRLVNPALERT